MSAPCKRLRRVLTARTDVLALRGKPFSFLAENGIDPFAQGYTPPEGESFEMLQKRVEQAWSLIISQAETVPEGEALVVR